MTWTRKKYNFFIFAPTNPPFTYRPKSTSPKIRQQSYVVVFFNEISLHSLVFIVRPCKISPENFQNFRVRPKTMGIA